MMVIDPGGPTSAAARLLAPVFAAGAFVAGALAGPTGSCAVGLRLLICLCLVKDAAVEQQVTLLGSHLLFASRPDFLGNPASFKLSPRIRFITTAPVLDGATALCELGAAARRIVVGHLSQCWQSDKRNSDGEHCSVHGVNSSLAHVAGPHSSGITNVPRTSVRLGVTHSGSYRPTQLRPPNPVASRTVHSCPEDQHRGPHGPESMRFTHESGFDAQSSQVLFPTAAATQPA